MGDLVVMPRRARVRVLLLMQAQVLVGYVFGTLNGTAKFKAVKIDPPFIELEAVEIGCAGNVAPRSITDLVYPTWVPNCVRQDEAATGGSGS